MTDTSGVSGAYQYGAAPMQQQSGTTLEQARQMSLNLDIIRTTNPWMFNTPGAAEALAVSGLPPDQIASRGAEIYAMQNMDAFAQSMQQMSPIAQRAAWSRLGTQQQAALRSLGYEPQDNEDGQFLGGALGPIGSGIGFAWQGVSNVGGAVLGPTLDGLTWLGDQPAHLYRTIRTMDGEVQLLALGAAIATGGVLGLGVGLGGTALAGGALGLAGSMGLGTMTSAGLVGMTALGGATAAAAIYGRGAWWDAFQNTANGERVFSLESQRRARSLLGGDEYLNLAREVAMEIGQDIDLWDIATEVAGERGAGGMNQMAQALERIAADMAEPGTVEYQTIWNGLNTLVQQEPFRQAIDALNNGKISFGRDIANLAGLDPGDKFYNLVSGSMDAAWVWGMDPLLGAGALRRANRIRKYAIPGLDARAGITNRGHAIDYIINLSNNDPKVRAVHEQIAMAVRAGRPELMPKASRGQWFQLHEFARQIGKIDDSGRVTDFGREDFLQWIATGDGLKSILSGQGTVRGINRPVLSTVSSSRGWGRFTAEAKGVVDALDDAALETRIRNIAKKFGVEVDLDAVRASRQLEQYLDDGALVTLSNFDERAAGGLGYALGEAVAWVPGTQTVGKFLGSITAMAPDSRAVSLVGNGSEESIRRWVDSMGRTFGLPKQMRDEWVSAVVVQGNVSQRMNVMQSYLDSLLTASGMRLTDQGEELANRFLELHRHGYALGGADELMVGGRKLTRGWLPEAHSATHLLLPDLTELQKIVRKNDILHNILGIVDAELIETGMNRVWKPLILLRLGFIPRAAGEEALAWFARATSGGIVQELGAREIARAKAYHAARRAIDEGQVLTGAGAEAATWDLPAFARPIHWMLARAGFKHPVEQMLDTWRSTSVQFLEDGMAGGRYRRLETAGRGGVETVTGMVPQIGGRDIPELWRPLLLGREHSWRNLILGGVDPQLKRAADAWVLRHADAVMQGTSAMSHSLFQTDIVRPDRAVQITADPSAPGGIRREDIVTMRGQRERIYKQDYGYDNAAHHRIIEPLYDSVFGPSLARGLTHHFPQEFTTLTPPMAAEAIMGAKQIRSHAGRQLASVFLTPREDIVRGVAYAIEDQIPELAAILRGMASSGEPITVDRIGVALLDLRNAARANDDGRTASMLEKLINELDNIRPFVDAQVEGAERGWLVGAVASELYHRGDYYDPRVLQAWSTNETETLTRRPERVFYRGVKNDDTFQIDPETGDLLLMPQNNSDWGANVVSLSIFPDQSLGYAVSPNGFNSGSSVDGGLMIEVDGDFVLGLSGRSWDEVSASPRPYPMKSGTRMIDDYGEGVHLVGHPPGSTVAGRAMTTEDMGEVALVQAFDSAGVTSPEVNAWDNARGRVNQWEWRQNQLRELLAIDDQEMRLERLNQMYDEGFVASALSPSDARSDEHLMQLIQAAEDELAVHRVDLRSAEEALAGITYTEYDELMIESINLRDEIMSLRQQYADTERRLARLDENADGQVIYELNEQLEGLDLMIELGRQRISQNLDARIALDARRNARPVRIPKGKWRIQGADDMEAIAKAVADGTIQGDSRWPWLADVRFRAGQTFDAEGITRYKTMLGKATDDDMPFFFDMISSQLTEPNDPVAALARSIVDEVADELGVPAQRVRTGGGDPDIDRAQIEVMHRLRDRLDPQSMASSGGRTVEELHGDLVGWIDQYTDQLGDLRANKTPFEATDDIEWWEVPMSGLAVDEPEVRAVLRALGDELKAMPENEYKLLAQMVTFQSPPGGHTIAGVALDEHEYFAYELLNNADMYRRRSEQILRYRNAGGWAVEQPVWTPFTSTPDELNRMLVNDLTAQGMRPENSEWMRQSQRASISGEVNVADQVPDGMQRIYAPAVSSDPEVVRAMDRAMQAGLEPSTWTDAGEQIINPDFVEAVVDDLLGRHHAFRMHTDFVKGLEEGPRRNALARAIDQFILEGRNSHVVDGTGWGMTLPMHGIGYSDPRMAQWVGDVLSGTLEPNPVKALGYLDIPRGLNNYAGGVRFGSNYGPGGSVYELAPIVDGNLRHIDASQTVQMPDGSWAPGAAYTKGIEDHANVAVDIVNQLWRGGSTETYTLRDDVAGQVFMHTRPGTMDPVPEGYSFTKPTDLFDADGNPIPWADPRFFNRTMSSGGDDSLFYEVLGPMLADLAAQRGGYSKIVPKEYMDLRPTPGIYDVDEMATTSIELTHSRVDDITAIKPRLPDATITEVPKPVRENLLDKAIRWGFNKVIGPAINSLVRRPMSFHYFAEAYKQNMTAMRWFLDEDLFRSVDRVFENEIRLLNEATEVTDQMMMDISTINLKWYGDAQPIDEDLARRWIGSHAGSQKDWERLADDAWAAAMSEGKPDVAEAWERLSDLDHGPFRISSLGADEATSPAELLVLSYRELIPAKVRSEGFEAVNTYIRTHMIGLPHVSEARWAVMDNAIRNWDYVFDMVEETATIRALENVVPFLDDHSERSQFAVAARNWLPFWYAEELFLKRWARTLEIAPESVRKGQLLYMGMRSAGVIETDPNGQDWVVYPGSNALNTAMGKWFPFMPDTLPVGTVFRASTDSMLPGINENLGAPQLGPIAAFPVDALTKMFPEMVDARKALLGEVGATASLDKGPLEAALTQFVPASVRRFWRAFTSDENSAVTYANAMSYAMATMLADNPSMLDNASPQQLEEFLDRARNHARVIMIGQAITGFVVPGAPVAMNSGEDVDLSSFSWWTGVGVDNPDSLISDTYRRYIKNAGIDEGTRRFLADFPYAGLEDITPEGALMYTAPNSVSVSGSPLPATRTGMAWYEQNESWVKGMPYAGPWLIPHDSDTDEFDYYSYSQQVTYGMRKRNAPEDVLNSMIYRTAAGPYFEARRQYETMKAEIPSDNRVAHQYLDTEWDKWSTVYLGTHPVFADELVSGTARERRRQTIEQMRYAVNDPQAPESPHLEAIKELVDAYDTYTVTRKQLSVERSQRYLTAKETLKTSFDDWVGQWILRNPELERLWSSVYQPESGL